MGWGRRRETLGHTHGQAKPEGQGIAACVVVLRQRAGDNTLAEDADGHCNGLAGCPTPTCKSVMGP
eukprot:7599059-Lingulodinium_polyedra.AAC.1